MSMNAIYIEHGWLLTQFDFCPPFCLIILRDFCNFHRFKDSSKVVEAFSVDALYLKCANQDIMPDYRVSGVFTVANNFSQLLIL